MYDFINHQLIQKTCILLTEIVYKFTLVLKVKVSYFSEPK